MMKKLFSLPILLAAFSLAAYCQEEPEKKFQELHFIEAGTGTILSDSHFDAAAITVALSNSLGKYIANFIDYNMGFDKSGVVSHELSFKVGPYLRFNNYSYLALSTGFSYYTGQSESDWIYMNGKRDNLKESIISIPVQAKINFEMIKGFSFGLKGTFNKVIDKNNPDRGSAMMYLGYGW